MSILTEKLPTYLTVQGVKCKINSDFRIWLKVSALFEQMENDPSVIVKIFKLIYEKLPPNLYDGLSEIAKFYAHNPKARKKTAKKEETQKKAFDFEYDDELIYSAFCQQYHIDLCDTDMHWWKFKALLNGLTEDTQFVKVMQFRMTDLSQIRDKEQKKFYAKMKSMYQLPDNRSEEQKEKSLNQALESMF